MDYVAHRGYAAEYPENTLAAFRGAAASADWIEFDVRRCGSGELVVVHDEDVDRVTDDEGAVGCTPWETLRDLDVLGSGAGIPRLDDALDVIPPGVGVQIELKELSLAADVSAALTDHDNPAILISFSPLALQEARAAAPDTPLGYVLHDGVYGDDPELGIDNSGVTRCTCTTPPGRIPRSSSTHTTTDWWCRRRSRRRGQPRTFSKPAELPAWIGSVRTNAPTGDTTAPAVRTCRGSVPSVDWRPAQFVEGRRTWIRAGSNDSEIRSPSAIWSIVRSISTSTAWPSGNAAVARTVSPT